MFDGKPIIGLLGGIGSGKSFVAAMFGQLGCAVISADEMVSRVYDDPAVRQTLARWWGGSVLKPDGSADRKAIADRVFADAAQRQRLEALLHPLVTQQRQQAMRQLAGKPGVRAFIWDIPLLVETGVEGLCDVLVFVDAPLEIRMSRVAAGRGWGPIELERRENLQAPLDKKRAISQYTVVNAAEAGVARKQVEDVLSRILTEAANAPKT